MITNHLLQHIFCNDPGGYITSKRITLSSKVQPKKCLLFSFVMFALCLPLIPISYPPPPKKKK